MLQYLSLKHCHSAWMLTTTVFLLTHNSHAENYLIPHSALDSEPRVVEQMPERHDPATAAFLAGVRRRKEISTSTTIAKIMRREKLTADERRAVRDDALGYLSVGNLLVILVLTYHACQSPNEAIRYIDTFGIMLNVASLAVVSKKICKD